VGNYSCIAEVNTSSPYLTASSGADSIIVGKWQIDKLRLTRTGLIYLIIPAGTLGFYLNGTAYPNGSTVLRTDIGQGPDALQCTTDSITCCTDATGEMLAGEFYSANGNMVPAMDDNMLQSDYYRTRGSGHILFNRRTHTNTTSIGQFCCSIPNANGIMVNLYINIGEDVGDYPVCMQCPYLLSLKLICMDITTAS
jgi:hypothetical protein